MTHVPSKIVVYCADSRSQYDNRMTARAEIERRLRERDEQRQARDVNAVRVAQANSERSAKSFTWNMQRNTVADHTTGKTWRLKDFMRGKP